MNRRGILKIVAAGAADATLGGDLATLVFQYSAASLRSSAAGRARRSELRIAWRKAREQRKPLLVLLVPQDETERFERGELFGGLLNVCDLECLSAIALCELVCASAEAVRQAFGETSVTGEPLALLVEASGTGGRVYAIEPEIPPESPPDELLEGAEPHARKDDKARWRTNLAEAAAYARISVMANAIRAAVVGDRTTLRRRAEAAREGLSSGDLLSLTEIADGKAPIRFPICDRGAAILLELADQVPARRPIVFEALRRAAYGRFLAVPPPGARWARHKECSWDFEGEVESPFVVFLCGGGYTPTASRRFLHFLTNS